MPDENTAGLPSGTAREGATAPGTGTGTGSGTGSGVARESGTAPGGTAGPEAGREDLAGDTGPGGREGPQVRAQAARAAQAPEGVAVPADTGGQGAATTRAGAGATGAGGRLISHDEGDKWALRLQHAVAGFVDAPRDSVEEADQVLQEVTQRFTDAVTQRRRTLRASWQITGEDKADTEQLRLALRDYRGLSERLLRL